MMAAEVAVPVAPDMSRRGSLRRLLRLLSRSCLIWRCAAKQLIKVAIVKRRYKRSPVTDPEFSAARRQLAVDLRDILILLGPTFIKLGQILSTRYDILPYDYVKGLERLQDSVPAFDGELAYSIVQSEIGENAFSAFDREPIAAASLGQVHLATTAAGERVAVKVQRPGLKQLFDADLINLKILAELLYKLDTTPDSMLRDWREIFESNARIIYEEIDYTKEATNGRKFARNFREFPWIKGAPHRCRAQRAAVPSSAQLISPSQIPLLLSACR